MEDGLDFDPNSCGPFYESEQGLEESGSFAESEFYWFSRVEDVPPEMWQIYIEAIATPTIAASLASEGEYTLYFDLGIAVRGKNRDEEKWHTVFDQFDGEGQ